MKLNSGFMALFVGLSAFSSACFAQKMVISLDKMNVFYLGLDNPISINATNCPCDRILIRATNGTLSGSGCKYNFSPDHIGSANITVFEKGGGKLKNLGTNRYRVKLVPLPILKIGPYGACGSTVRKLVIAAQEFVLADLTNFDFDARYRVDSFHVTIVRDSSETKKFVNISSKIGKKVREAFSLLKKDDTIIFDKIFVHSDQLNAAFLGITYGDDGTTNYDKTEAVRRHKIELELEPAIFKVYE